MKLRSAKSAIQRLLDEPRGIPRRLTAPTWGMVLTRIWRESDPVRNQSRTILSQSSEQFSQIRSSQNAENLDVVGLREHVQHDQPGDLVATVKGRADVAGKGAGVA